MRVQDVNMTINATGSLDKNNGAAEAAESGKRTGKSSKSGKNGDKLKTIYAGDLNICKQDSIESKKKQAQKMAMNVIKNAFSGDKEIDNEVNERRQHIEDLKKENKEYGELLGDIAKEREALKEKYGVQEGSQEEKELELLRKGNDMMQSLALSEDERQQLSDIRKRGLTDYQSEMLNLDSPAKEYIGKINDNNKMIIEDNAIVRGIRIERLKSHAMDDAADQADDIMETANKEIIGMLVDEAKDKIDADRAEQEEKAEEKKEEEQELEEKIEAAKARADKAEQKSDDDDDDIIYKANELLDQIDMVSQAQKVEAAQKSLNQMVGELALTADDLKGVAVDEKL